MATVHPNATITPTKLEIARDWLVEQPWFDGDPDALAEKYSRAAGVELDHWDFYMALGYFKVAIIAAGTCRNMILTVAPCL